MQKIKEQKLYRILDANFNRSKEGLRVCEDICRFLLDERSLTSQYKAIRHQLTAIARVLGLMKVISFRDTQHDVGRASTATEFKRKNVADVFYANSQRIKESIRVLEEFSKIQNKKSAQDLKKLRYKIYALEKKTVSRF